MLQQYHQDVGDMAIIYYLSITQLHDTWYANEAYYPLISIFGQL